jgi:uncharacterized oligopeptide transporter (OPT) family protein
MTTVGYGDISSQTLAEKIWAIVTMIVSGFFFSFVVGRMASLVSTGSRSMSISIRRNVVRGTALLAAKLEMLPYLRQALHVPDVAPCLAVMYYKQTVFVFAQKPPAVALS